MSRNNVAYSLVALASLGCAAYFAIELHGARAELARIRATSPTPATPAGNGNQFAKSSPPAATPAPAPPSSDDERSARRASAMAQLPVWRATLEDPTARDRILADTTALSRRLSPGMQKYVGLSNDEFSRMMGTLTDMDLKIREQRYRCALQPDCDDLPILQGIEPERQRLLADLLGPDKKQRLDTYEHNAPERAVVTNLRGTLRDPDSLGDHQADQLIDALGDERRKVEAEWQQKGVATDNFWGIEAGIVLPNTAQSVEQKLAEGRAYQRRMSTRAGEILNARQVEQFSQIQEDWLNSVRQGWDFQAKGTQPVMK